MNKSSFSIRKSKLNSELVKIKKAFKGLSAKKFSTVLEITITDDLLTLIVPGIKIEIPCKTVSTVKASLDYFYFVSIVKEWKKPILECTFYDNEMHFGITTINVQTTFFQDDSILRSIKLPINFTDWHLLRLENKNYTIEEISFNGLDYMVNCAKGNMLYNAERASEFLALYGITTQEVIELIEKKIKLE
jgi:hypothetical protein